MGSLYLQEWMQIVSNPANALLHPVGTSLWIDGLNLINQLKIESFFKKINDMTDVELKAFTCLQLATDESIQPHNFLVSAHICLLQHSPLYKSINSKSKISAIKYEFTSDETGEFEPWTNRITLGNKFFSNVDGQIRIPFYTFNHENTHLTLFKDVYSNIEIFDEELIELILLVEWFCISLDLILAHDLLKAEQHSAFTEICRVSAKPDSQVFSQQCKNINSVNKFADKFRTTFIYGNEFTEVYELISKETLHNHRTYANENLIKAARKIPSNMLACEARMLLNCLRKKSLTDLIFNLTGIKYNDTNI